MKILAAFFGLTLLVSSVPAKAETKYPEDFLMNSLGKVTVCIRSQKIGMNKLAAMVKQLQTDEPDMVEDHKKILLKMIDGVNDLNEIIEAEKLMGISLIEVLMEDYKHTLEDINTSMKPYVEPTDKNMKELLKDITEFDEFNRVFMPKMDMCATAVEDIGNQAEKLQKSLETQN